MYMKKMMVLAAALLLGWQANAQIIANVGYAHGFENVKVDVSSNLSNKHLAHMDGLYAGANYYYSLDNVLDGFAVLPGANFSFLLSRTVREDRIREVALNIPVQASYTHEINETVKIFGQTGPTFQVGLIHKAKITETGTSFSLYNSNNQYGYVRNRFNIYWGFAGGVEVSDTFRVEVGFDLGFLDLGRGKELHIGRNFLHFGLGYLF